MGFFKNLFGGGKDEATPATPAPTAPAAPTQASKPDTPPEPSRKPEAERKPRKSDTRKQQEDEDMEGVQRLLARKVERVLEQLGMLAVRARAGEELPPVTITLHLAHGHSLTGEVVDYVPREAVLLALGKEGLLRSESVAYVDLASVVAVSVGNAEKLLEMPQLVRPTPTRQDLLSLAERLPHALIEQYWPGETSLGVQTLRFEIDWMELDDEPGRRALEGALNVTNHALRALAQERGREVLRRFAKVRFARGKDTRASLEADTAVVTVSPSNAEPTTSAFRKGLASGL